MVLLIHCYAVFHFLMFLFLLILMYVDYIFRLVWVTTLLSFFRKSCYVCLPSVHFVAALLYLAVLPFDVGGLICILFHQFLIRSLVYFTCHGKL